MNRTCVINLFGAPASGKSTTAAGLFYRLKLANKDCELITEYVKRMARMGKPIQMFDQIKIFSKQAVSEYELYNTTDYLITDCPLLLPAIYHNHYNNNQSTTDIALTIMRQASNNGVTYKNFMLKRTVPYVQVGRYETEDAANALDGFITKQLQACGVDFTAIENDENTLEKIMRVL
jgi:hypothetical protein